MGFVMVSRKTCIYIQLKVMRNAHVYVNLKVEMFISISIFAKHNHVCAYNM